MPKTDTSPARAPRGSKPVAAAFFAALDSVPEAARTAIAKAAQLMIRDELKLRRDKAKATAAKMKARKPPAAKPAKPAKSAPAAKAPAPKPMPEPAPEPAPKARRARKPPAAAA